MKKRITKKPINQKQIKAIKKVAPEAPVAPVQQPQISNEQYTLNVMTSRCKTLETQVLALVKEVARLKTKYEPAEEVADDSK